MRRIAGLLSDDNDVRIAAAAHLAVRYLERVDGAVPAASWSTATG